MTERVREEAAALIAEARRNAERVVVEAAAEARESEHAKVAALYLRLKNEDETRADRDLDRAVDLALVLAERLLGKALELDPGLVADIARGALAEARGARTVVIEACPLDAAALESHLVHTGFGARRVEIRADATLARGCLHLVTNLGNLDAKLRPQLERLAKALRETLRGG